jgi:LPXTG-motif cell wall-anchored protein
MGADSVSSTITHAYSAQGNILGNNPYGQTVTNSLSGSGPFDSTSALSVLSPLSAWAECSTVQTLGFYLTAITPVNPCIQAATPTTTALAQTGKQHNFGPLAGALAAIVAGASLLLARRKNETA